MTWTVLKIQTALALLPLCFYPHIFGESCSVPSFAQKSLSPPAVVIVGPYYSKTFGSVARKMGLETIAVYGNGTLSGGQITKNEFDHVVRLDSDETDLGDSLFGINSNIVGVIPVSEWSSSRIARIRNSIDQRQNTRLPGNFAGFSMAHRNKRVFYETLRDAGLPFPEFLVANQSNVFEKFSWPVVIKPALNCGSSHVTFCFNGAEIRRAVGAIKVGQLNKMLEIEESPLLTEYLRGQEFAVDGVRTHGRTQFTGIWEYTRKVISGASTRYVSDRLLPFEGNIQEILITITSDVLNAIGYKFGPFHLELIIGEHGPVPNDFSARLAGGNFPQMETIATGLNPFKLTLKALTDKLRLLTDKGYTLRNYPAVVFISSEGGGKRASLKIKSELNALKRSGKVAAYQFNYLQDALLPRTIDADTVVALISVLGQTPDHRDQIVKEIESWQNQGRFEY